MSKPNIADPKRPQVVDLAAYRARRQPRPVPPPPPAAAALQAVAA